MVVMRVLVADSQARVRSALRLLIEHQPGLTVAGEASNQAGLQEAVENLTPDVILFDWTLPGGRPDEALAALRRAYPGTQVIVLSGQPEARDVALGNGAQAFIIKSDPPEMLLTALKSARAATAGVGVPVGGNGNGNGNGAC